MEKIIVLLDYKNSYGSKFDSTPPYSGLDLTLFKSEALNFNFDLVFLNFNEIDFDKPTVYKNSKVLYQSPEPNDNFGQYKSFVDDVLFFLKLSGAMLIPEYKYFKAHSNKVFMEMLRSLIELPNSPKNYFFGTQEEFKLSKNSFKEFPYVIKKSHGAQSNGVFKAENLKELEKIIAKISKTDLNLKEKIKEKVRSLKYSGYKKFSSNRNKFIIQSFTRGLSGDYKVLIFWDKFFLIKRENRPNDFRASGGGFNTFAGEFEVPKGLLEFSNSIFQKFNVPFISLDIGINQEGFQIIEFQFVSFGTSGHSKSRVYFEKKENGQFDLTPNKHSLEFLYSYSLSSYLKKF